MAVAVKSTLLKPSKDEGWAYQRQVSDKYRSSAEAASEQLRLMKEAQLLQDRLRQSTSRCERSPTSGSPSQGMKNVRSTKPHSRRGCRLRRGASHSALYVLFSGLVTFNDTRLEKLHDEHGNTMSRYATLQDSHALLESALATQRAGT